MELRPYQPQDLDAILELFYETVHAVNRRDYSPASWMLGPQAAGPGPLGPIPGCTLHSRCCGGRDGRRICRPGL